MPFYSFFSSSILVSPQTQLITVEFITSIIWKMCYSLLELAFIQSNGFPFQKCCVYRALFRLGCCWHFTKVRTYSKLRIMKGKYATLEHCGRLSNGLKRTKYKRSRTKTALIVITQSFPSDK